MKGSERSVQMLLPRGPSVCCKFVKFCLGCNIIFCNIPSDLLFLLFSDTNHEVLFAFCPKVASTTWLRMMIQISGRYRGDIPLRNITLDSPSLQRYGLVYLSKLSAAEGQQKLDSYKKVLFVRNPFERVLSAYKDKLSSAKGKMLYQRMFGRDIMKRKRPNATNEELKTGVGVTFPEFVSWLVDIENVLALDPHFRPIHTLSKPCVLHYDFIGRFETLHDDIDYVLHKLFKLESTKHLPFHNMSKETSKNVIAQNYRNVPTSHIEKIREIYKLDFHLFGYSKDVPGL